MTKVIEELQKSYYEIVCTPVAFLRLLFNLKRIIDEWAPKSLWTEQDEATDVYEEQTGGV